MRLLNLRHLAVIEPETPLVILLGHPLGYSWLLLGTSLGLLLATPGYSWEHPWLFLLGTSLVILPGNIPGYSSREHPWLFFPGTSLVIPPENILGYSSWEHPLVILPGSTPWLFFLGAPLGYSSWEHPCLFFLGASLGIPPGSILVYSPGNSLVYSPGNALVYSPGVYPLVILLVYPCVYPWVYPGHGFCSRSLLGLPA